MKTIKNLINILKETFNSVEIINDSLTHSKKHIINKEELKKYFRNKNFLI